MSSPAFWASPFKYLRYTTYHRPHLVAAYVMGVGGPLAALTLYGTREKYLYKDAPVIPLSYPLPAQRDTSLTGYDDEAAERRVLTLSMESVAAFGCGCLFAAGLMISGMSNPAKVTNFLDIKGAWDPSLAFVMGGAILVAMPIFRYVAGHSVRTLQNRQIKMPENTKIDARLVAGSAIFGVGWALGGICPAPAFTLVSAGAEKAVPFVAAMLAGVLLQGIVG